MFKEIEFLNPKILEFTIPASIFTTFQQSLLEVPKRNSENFTNKNLVGQIESEFRINCPSNLKFFILESAEKYRNYYKYHQTSSTRLQSFWVNYQKKHEYNPTHSHTGILSFIIFVKIPFLLENEDALVNTKDSMQHTNGRVMFTYQTCFNNLGVHTIDVDKSFEGKMLMFPNSAYHTVYPFYTSDDYRITVSGNLDIVRD
jgi:hypothetical protein